jgi:excisionase family DNA binding protein
VTVGPFLTVDEVAELIRCSRRVVHGLTASNEIPHRKLSGQRRCLFVRTEVERWVVDQPELETIVSPNGGRIVRIKEGT